MKFITANPNWIQIQKSLFIISFVVFSNHIIAQTVSRSSSLNKSNYVSDFHAIQTEMENYWETQNVKDGYVSEDGVRSKVPNWKLYKRWEYYWEQRVDQTTGAFPTTNSVIEYEKYLSTKKRLNKTTYNENWTSLGTDNSTGGYAGIGRINCVTFHPTDNNVLWVGSPSGGIWKTTNGGSSWEILNDDQLVLGVSDIAIPSDYATSNTIYIATGDRDGGSMWSLSGGQTADNVSIGVLKSTDGGVTWNTTGLTYAKSLKFKIYSLLIHPANTSILFASTSEGVYKTTNSGLTWSLKSSYPLWRMAFKPGDPTIIYGTEIYTGDQYFDRSTDTGETWADNLYGSGTDARRTELAVSANDPNVVYLLTCNSTGGLKGIYKSTDSGVSFSQINTNTSQNMLGYYSDGSGATSGQGSYDLCIACSPADANTVFIGGINTWKSTDGGVNWTINNMWTSSSTYNKSGSPVVHADKHALNFQNGTTLFEGNDGGIYKTTDGGTTWTDLSNGLVISQIYRVGVSQTSSTTVLTGLQDNGSKLYNSGFWTDVTGGDGMECIVDYSSSSYMYATYVRGTIYRSTNGGASFPTTISANIPAGQPVGQSPIGAWVTPYAIDPTTPATLFAGYDKIWKTTNRGNTWTSASQQLSATDKLRSLVIAASNSNIVYTADRSNMWKATDGGATNWTSITLPTTANYLTYIAVKNNDPNTVWITYGGYTDGAKVYESTDGGSNWTNISTGLPNLPIMCIVQYKNALDRNVLFVGTDVGVYVKDGSNDWASYNSGLPNVVVTELEILYTGSTDKLRAGTFGRGLWETNIDEALPVELTSFTANFKNNSVILNWTTETEVKNFGFEIERKNKDIHAEVWEKIGFIKGSGNSNSPKNYSFEDRKINSGTNLYRLKQIDNDGQYNYSSTIEVFAAFTPTEYVLEQNYPNPFNPTTTIKYQIPKSGFVQLKIYNVLGREVAVLVNETKSEGEYSVEFDAGKLSSGVYLYKLQTDSYVETKKLTLIK